RGSGYGTRLLNFVINEAMANSKEYLSLYTYVSKEHQAALRLYERFRFKAFLPNRVTRNGEIYLKRALGHDVIKKKD
ncbi:GNAT family N-acetyltransferase, partial [Hydrogenimonas sp.]